MREKRERESKTNATTLKASVGNRGLRHPFLRKHQRKPDPTCIVFGKKDPLWETSGSGTEPDLHLREVVDLGTFVDDEFRTLNGKHVAALVILFRLHLPQYHNTTDKETTTHGEEGRPIVQRVLNPRRTQLFKILVFLSQMGGGPAKRPALHGYASIVKRLAVDTC